MKPKVSIIVPIYNVDAYLDRCFESLLAQTLTEVEIIAVNDGSTDNSLEILEKYADKDARIKVINKENGGVSSARNTGLSLATGTYIGFVDPDDWVDEKMYEVMYNTAINQGSDIVMCSYMREFGSHAKEKRFNLADQITYRDQEVQEILRRLVGPLKEEVAQPEFLDAWGTVWSKLYRREIIIDNYIKFTDLNVIGTNEDTLFNIQSFYNAEGFTFINQPFYHYWRANSTSVTTGYKPELMEKWASLYRIIENFIREKNLNNDFQLALNNRISMNTLGLGLNELSKANKASVVKKINKINRILNDTRIKKSFSQLETEHFPFIWRVFYNFGKYRFSVGFYGLLLSIELLRKLIR
ncbi:MAG: glycosyltransferase [Anaerobacillus sp.]|uniref:glycosyltransferase n=1 Tax=Anaerobacillus sp. TaxID=1872506 RepID=UPI00391BF6FE